MKGYELNQHNFKKGRFSTPWSDFMKENGGVFVSWFDDRLPEYFWIGLILDHYSNRTTGINIVLNIIRKLYEIESSIKSPKISEIISLPCDKQVIFFKYLKANTQLECGLSSISLILPYDLNVPFMKVYSDNIPCIKDRVNTIVGIIQKTSDHQSQLSTDIRYIVLKFKLMSGKLIFPESERDTLKLLDEYPCLDINDEKMHSIRPFIRACEMTELTSDKNINYLNNFWEVVSKMSECELCVADFKKEINDGEEFKQLTKKNLTFYNDILMSNPMDNKLLVLLGLATYAYKRFCELVDYRLFNEISGRSIVRCMIECRIMMKYLLKHESEREDIWEDYKRYGIGSLKLVVKRWEESKIVPESHVNNDYSKIIVNEYVDENLIDMDVRYFDKKNIRDKAIDVCEKDDYGLYYDYDSSFEHGLWGAIRESSLIKCISPAHKYHCIADINNVQKLPSVLHDAQNFMSKILDVLADEYGKMNK